MQTPDNLAGRITEEIMLIFSRFDDAAEVALPADQYNFVYSHIYTILDKRIPDNPLSPLKDNLCTKCGLRLVLGVCETGCGHIA